MILELFKSGMILAELSSEYSISKSTINGWIKDVKEIKVDKTKYVGIIENEAIKTDIIRIYEVKLHIFILLEILGDI